MTVDTAATLAMALALDEPEQLLAYVKQLAIERATATAPLDVKLAKKWNAVADALADAEKAVMES